MHQRGLLVKNKGVIKMINRVELKKLLDEKRELDAQLKQLSEQARDFDGRLCKCMGKEPGSIITHDEILIEVLKDD